MAPKTRFDQPSGRTHDDGRPMTVGDVVLDRAALGLTRREVAAAAGISVQTLYTWLRDAALAQARVATTPAARLTKKERQLVEWVETLARVDADAWAGLIGVVTGEAHGGRVQRRVTTTTVTEHVPDGEGGRVTKAGQETVTVVEEVAGPNWKAAAWRLQHGPQASEYRDHLDVVVGGVIATVADLDANRAADLVAALQAMREARPDTGGGVDDDDTDE